MQPEGMVLERSFPSKHRAIQSFNKKCCKWGLKRVKYEKDPHIMGKSY